MTEFQKPAAFERTEESRRHDLRFFFRLMVTLAFATVCIGAALGPWHGVLNLSTDEARTLATGFLLAGIGDTLVLYFWSAIFSIEP
jgi:hypothetical protein